MSYQRRIVCSANLCRKTGHMILGARHWDETMHVHYGLFKSAGNVDVNFEEQGFIDQHGVFLTRQEAWKVAEAAGQILRRVGGDTFNGGTLYSENLY